MAKGLKHLWLDVPLGVRKNVAAGIACVTILWLLYGTLFADPSAVVSDAATVNHVRGKTTKKGKAVKPEAAGVDLDALDKEAHDQVGRTRKRLLATGWEGKDVLGVLEGLWEKRFQQFQNKPKKMPLGSLKEHTEKIQELWKKSYDQAKTMVGKCTLDQKLKLIHGSPETFGYAGYVEFSPPKAGYGESIYNKKGVKSWKGEEPDDSTEDEADLELHKQWQENLGKNPGLKMNDGSQGFSHYYHGRSASGGAVMFPSLLHLAATFDPQAVADYASAVAGEFRGKGANVMIGPDLSIVRTPFSGRSFESLTGEDPFLGEKLGRIFVATVQSRGVISVARDWVNHNQEYDRMTHSADVGERAQHEIYYPPFEGAIQGGLAGVMCAYNRVNSTYACESRHELKALREELGFKGFIVSGWGATHSTKKAAQNGLDIEMPGEEYFGDSMKTAIKGGEVDMETLNRMAKQTLAAMFAVGHFDKPFPDKGEFDTVVATQAHRDMARKIAARGTILLKNKGRLLPLRKDRLSKVVMMGKHCNNVEKMPNGGVSIFAGGGSTFVDTPHLVTPTAGMKAQLSKETTLWHLTPGARWPEELSHGDKADVAIVCLLAHGEEGKDRQNLQLEQASQLIDEANHVAERVVAAVFTAGAVTLSAWEDKVSSILVAFLPGEQAGHALADVIFGKEPPRGRLPVTFPIDERDLKLSSAQYPGVPESKSNPFSKRTTYSEGMFVGYRWYNWAGMHPHYPFGFGLTYSSFEYLNLQVDCSQIGVAMVHAFINNTGKRTATEIVQLYVSHEMSAAPRALRGFTKLKLGPGQAHLAEFGLTTEDWKYWDERGNRWISALEYGPVHVHVGPDSEHLPLSEELKVEECSDAYNPDILGG